MPDDTRYSSNIVSPVGRTRYDEYSQITVGVAAPSFYQHYPQSGVIFGIDGSSTSVGLGVTNPHNELFEEKAAHSTPYGSGYSPLGILQSGAGFQASNTSWASDLSNETDRSTKFEFQTPSGPVGTKFNSLTT